MATEYNATDAAVAAKAKLSWPIDYEAGDDFVTLFITAPSGVVFEFVCTEGPF
jgi:hypothetical protein